jgi:hypothetical protein
MKYTEARIKRDGDAAERSRCVRRTKLSVELSSWKGFCPLKRTLTLLGLAALSSAERPTPNTSNNPQSTFLQDNVPVLRQQQQLYRVSSINILDASPKLVEGFKRRREREATISVVAVTREARPFLFRSSSSLTLGPQIKCSSLIRAILRDLHR